MKARYIRAQVLEQLRQDVANNLEKYRVGDFLSLAQDPALFFEGTPTIDPTKLAEVRNPENNDLFEIENCQTTYEAISSFTPYEARDERFWVYLSHTYLLEYSRQRWPIPDQKEDAIKHIQTHFFARDKRGIDRDNAVSRLWWMAHLCSRVPQIDLSTSLRVLLYRSDVRANIVERPSISQNTKAFSTIIKVLRSSLAADKALFERAHFRAMIRQVNSIGGFRLLDYMPEQQIAALIADLAANVKPAQKEAATKTPAAESSKIPARELKPRAGTRPARPSI